MDLLLAGILKFPQVHKTTHRCAKFPTGIGWFLCACKNSYRYAKVPTGIQRSLLVRKNSHRYAMIPTHMQKFPQVHKNPHRGAKNSQRYTTIPTSTQRFPQVHKYSPRYATTLSGLQRLPRRWWSAGALFRRHVFTAREAAYRRQQEETIRHVNQRDARLSLTSYFSDIKVNLKSRYRQPYTSYKWITPIKVGGNRLLLKGCEGHSHFCITMSPWIASHSLAPTLYVPVQEQR